MQQNELEHLRLLIERIDPANYTFEERGNEVAPIDFNWPEAIAQKNAEALRTIAEKHAISMLPWRCREFLDKGTPLPPDQRERLWDFLQSIEFAPGPPPDDDDGSPSRVEDVLCAGIALLFATSRDWLLEDGRRMTWCRARLEAILDHPPSKMKFGSEHAIGDQRWDSFSAECGVLLLVEDQNDALARKLVAAAVTAFNHHTTALTVRRAVLIRERLGSEFDRIISLAVHWGRTATTPSAGVRDVARDRKSEL